MRATLYLTLSIISLFISGCDRLSEKEKMEMRVLCDSEFRKKISPMLQKQESSEILSYVNEVETKYSFSDQRCYGRYQSISSSRANLAARLSGKSVPADEPNVTVILYDGITGETLLMAGWKGSLGTSNVSTDFVAGSQETTGMTTKQAYDLIGKRMATP